MVRRHTEPDLRRGYRMRTTIERLTGAALIAAPPFTEFTVVKP
jgi:hypothetical protein